MGLLATNWLGTLPAWLTLFGVAAVGFFVWKGAGGTALRTLETANRVLEREQAKDKAEIAKLRTEVAELRGRTDVTVAISPLITWSVQHEARAQERHDRTLVVLDLIAAKIGPEAS